MNPSTRGTWGELVAAVELMEQGYQLYRAVDPSAPCDFLAVAPTGELLRVEVKAATAPRKEGYRPGVAGVRPDRHDLLVVVLPDRTVLLNPTVAEVAGIPAQRPSQPIVA